MGSWSECAEEWVLGSPELTLSTREADQERDVTAQGKKGDRTFTYTVLRKEAGSWEK